ncbi:NAD(P)H-dependent flavin oxidoreductase [Sphingosinicella rhizophila]|uniref:Propionate 3-nitronate monooxygenase n=1 Tax=Sphingosinicella rhizophila TaxID=3050082 RepID=A0ABU3Q8R5_9SPHN|nr:nitronate monooxygenase [Sphingosinicella sp. GR2756]MDT9599494.1 nitronate monooxygenase [Sphingosinicella sp. GR2756]
MVGAATPWPDRHFLDLVGTRYPIVQAPMAGASDAALAVAAIKAGALGSLPCAILSPDAVRTEVAAIRRAATGAINLNFFCHNMPPAPDEQEWRSLLRPYHDEFGTLPPAEAPRLRMPFDAGTCALVEALKPEVVSFHFGLPAPALFDRVRAAGAVILGNATSVEEARWLQGRGVDAVIAQGYEAGGHAGRFLAAHPAAHMGLMALLPQIVDAVDVPVVAAGGIADARGIAAALTLGASAVQIGTAFLSCPESRISAAHRAALSGEDADQTMVTNLMTGGFARGVPNRLMRELGVVRREAPPFPYAASALAPLRAAAEARGDAGFSPLWAGQAARLGRPMPAAQLVSTLASGALALLQGRKEKRL